MNLDTTKPVQKPRVIRLTFNNTIVSAYDEGGLSIAFTHSSIRAFFEKCDVEKIFAAYKQLNKIP